MATADNDTSAQTTALFAEGAVSVEDFGRVAVAEPAPESLALATRYGRTPTKKRRDRLVYLVAGLAAAVVVVAWVVWAGLDQTGGTLETQDTGNTIINDHSVSISYRVSMPVGSTARCALQVQSEAHAIVGWKIVPVPASKTHSTSYTEVVQSSELGVTGLIYQCWLT